MSQSSPEPAIDGTRVGDESHLEASSSMFEAWAPEPSEEVEPKPEVPEPEVPKPEVSDEVQDSPVSS